MDPSHVLYKLFVHILPVFRSYPIKAVQKLIVCILPELVLLALFHTLVNTGGYVANPLHSITVYKINAFSIIWSSAGTVNPWTTTVTPWDRESLNAPVELTEGRPYSKQDNRNIGDIIFHKIVSTFI